ncbi:MAG: VOC family protein [Roseovarius sp.]
MTVKLHHINLSTDDVPRAGRFYREVMRLEAAREDVPRPEKTKGYAGDVEFVSDGAVQVHLSQRDAGAGFRAGQIVNPVTRGHIAFRTDDLKGFIARLERLGIPYSDWGNRAVAGWHQIFFHDPDGNVVEVHQKEAGA